MGGQEVVDTVTLTYIELYNSARSEEVVETLMRRIRSTV